MTKNCPHKYLWAKLDEDDKTIYHPLILHLLDVAACARAVLLREPETTRKQMADCIGLPWNESLPWLLLLVASHDIGKACPGFQLKAAHWREQLHNAGLHCPRLPDTKVFHGAVSQLALKDLLQESGFKKDMAEFCADAVGCHHGIRATQNDLYHLSGNRNGVDAREWRICWKEIFNAVKDVLGVRCTPVKETLSGCEFMLISGLASFVDWIGSNEDYFSYGNADDCNNLHEWFKRRCKTAEKSLDAIGWHRRLPLSDRYQPFAEVFPKCVPLMPLQEAIEKEMSKISSPCVLLIEAPMGEGKTEAAFYAHLELQRRFGHRGMYVALPTKATGNAMFKRALAFLNSFTGNRTLDLQLIHGAAQLNEVFQKIRIEDGRDPNSSVHAGEWFSNKKRALLSEYGVGTIDQALLTILPVRHYFVRLWGLANRVIIFDEIHAYDAYTGTLLFHLIRWLRALGSSVILLSATVPPEFRRRLAGVLDARLPEQDAEYPRLTVFSETGCKSVGFLPEGSRKQTISVEAITPKLAEIKTCIEQSLKKAGYGGVIVNTVKRAQNLYGLFGEGQAIESNGIVIGKKLSDGTQIHLFHARYPAKERQGREDCILSIYGKNENKDGVLAQRTGRCILIATQVVEQSLDLDFDVLVTDLAPIDLVLQRAGRLWRHKRGARSIKRPRLYIAGLAGENVGLLGSPLWWNKVYREDILIRSWEALKKKKTIVLPDNIESLVNAVYEGIAMPSEEEAIKRLEEAEINSDGELIAQRGMANQVIIGLPEDGSWKEASRHYLYDDEEPGIHHTLIAKTRLGEDSVTAIPIFIADRQFLDNEPDFNTAKDLFMRGISVSRKQVIVCLRKTGVPEKWKKNMLLRNCYPMIIDDEDYWEGHPDIRLDKELGLVYLRKEDV